MLLSIGMIVKNEQKYLRDCLTSIQPILDAVDSELIIFDTGSTDETVQIAKEFTNHVYEIEWRNDFAWARNHTIEKAQGDWYMFVDADEIFTDVSDIITFFNKGEHKKYKCASYRWRNHLENNVIAMFDPVRLFKNEKNLRFVGKIHEMIHTTSAPKNLQSIADHWGYFFDGAGGKEKAKAKHERNMTLLLEMHEEEPKNPRVMLLIAQDYMAHDNKKSCEFLLKCINTLGSNKSSMYYHACIYFLVRNYYIAKNYEEVINVVKEYFKNLKVKCQSLVHISSYYANAYLSLNRFEESAQAAKQTLKYFNLNKAGKLDTTITTITSLSQEILNNRTIHSTTIVLAAIGGGDFDTALAHVAECGNEKLDVFALFMQTCTKEKRWNDIPKLYDYALKCGVNSDNYHNIITTIESFVSKSETKKIVSEAMATSPLFKNKSDDYIQLHMLRYANFAESGHFTQSSAVDLNCFLNSDKQFSEVYGDVIVFAMKRQVDFSNFAENMTLTNSAEFISRVVTSNDDVPAILKKFIETGCADKSSAKANKIIYDMATFVFEQVKKGNDAAEKIAFLELLMTLKST
ncbi:MAG: glycosyltransferase [Defluviitaleaceae bacterium]|nr:glycosyltransferase [Defluviitaleaceae bacterium]MCL2262213.1 glycosyltransferase [Defluviitaleaceae bacterium]